jgi:LysM repeat protein
MEPGHRSPLRIVAPAVLVAFGLAMVILIVSGSGSGSGSREDAHPTKLEQRDLGAQRATRALAKGVYTVKPDDTFGSIAEKTGISVDTLIELNPDVDPQTLHEGQKIKLR